MQRWANYDLLFVIADFLQIGFCHANIFYLSEMVINWKPCYISKSVEKNSRNTKSYREKKLRFWFLFYEIQFINEHTCNAICKNGFKIYADSDI